MPSWVIDLRDPELLAHDWRQAGLWRLRESKYRNAESVLEPSSPGQLTVIARRVAMVTMVGGRMPFSDPRSDQPLDVEDLDRARTECLSQWTAMAVALDLDKELAARSPYQPRHQSYVSALEYMTRDFNYIRLRHQPIDSDVESVNSSVVPRSQKDRQARVYEQMSEKEKQKCREKRRKKRLKHRNGAAPDFFSGGIQAYEMCALFFTDTGYLGVCQGDLCVGDDIFILEGAEYPFVLRVTDVEGQFTVVGKVGIAEKHDYWDRSTLRGDGKAQELVLV